MKEKILYLPTVYFISKRLGGVKNAVLFVITELFPIFFALFYYHNANVLLIAISYLVGISVYELGYYENDYLEDHNKDFPVNRHVFYTARVIVIGLLIVMYLLAGGNHLMGLLLGNLVVWGVFAIHNYAPGLPIPYARVISFCTLRLVKYLPVVWSVVNFETAISYAYFLFIFLGLPSAIVYTLRKYGNEKVKSKAKNEVVMFNFYITIIFSALLFLIVEYSYTDFLFLYLWFLSVNTYQFIKRVFNKSYALLPDNLYYSSNH